MAASDIRARAHAEVLACLRDPEIQRWFLREAQGGEGAAVWRERAFDVILDGEWVSGVFDRLVFPETGRATILDFKSTRLGEVSEERLRAAASTYAGQVADYRQAMQMMVGEGWPIQVLLLFTEGKKVIVALSGDPKAPDLSFETIASEQMVQDRLGLKRAKEEAMYVSIRRPVDLQTCRLALQTGRAIFLT